MLQLSRNVFSSQSAAMRFDAVLVVHEAPSFARFLVSVFCSIGGMSSRSARVDYRKLHRASTADVLPIAKRRRQFVVSDGCFDISHVLAKRKAGKASDQFCTSPCRQWGFVYVVGAIFSFSDDGVSGEVGGLLQVRVHLGGQRKLVVQLNQVGLWMCSFLFDCFLFFFSFLFFFCCCNL